MELYGPPPQRPAVTSDVAFWWDGIEAGELRIQSCSSCHEVRHPPQPRCTACGSFDFGWVLAADTGEVHSFVVYRYPEIPGTRYPYCVGLIEVCEGIRVLAPLLPNDGTGVEIGSHVRLGWTTAADGGTWPYYELVSP